MHSFVRKALLQCSVNSWRHFSKTGFLKRHYLSPSYQCMEAFEKRFNEDLIKDIKSNLFFIKMMQSKKEDLKVFAIDADLYIQSLRLDGSNWNVEDLEELMYVLRRSPETINTLASTQHTILRLLLSNDCTESLFKILSQPRQYGLFLDSYTAKLIMNHYLTKHEYTYAARSAFHLMLAEDFGDPLCQMFVLLSSLQWAKNADNSAPWTDYEPKVEEPEEEVLVRHDYYPNPFFDDHFHLKDPNLCVGKTLAWCAKRHHPESDLGLNCQLLGYAMWRKWKKVGNIIKQISTTKSPVKISTDVLSLVKHHVTQYCADEEVNSKLLASLEQLSADTSFDVIANAEEQLKKLASSTEQEMVKEQESIYSEWATTRVNVMEQFRRDEEQKALMDEIKQKKRELLAEEQEQLYFHNEATLDLVLEQRGQYKHPFPRERPWRYTRIRKTKLDEEYVPPEMNKRGGQ